MLKKYLLLGFGLSLTAGVALAADGYIELKLSDGAAQGAIVYGSTDKDAQVYVDNEEIPVAPDGRFVFGVGRDADEVVVVAINPNGNKVFRTLKISKRKWNIQKIDGLANNMVEPSEEEKEKIREDSFYIKKARGTVLVGQFPVCFIKPVEGEVNSFFGSQRILNGVPKNPHGGIDIRAKMGTPIKASADGVVSHVNENSFYNGKLIIINHGYGMSSTYAHLSNIGVKEGQKVKRGDIIGLVGSTGRSTGPHLHFGISWKNTYIDPQNAFVITGKNCK